jgi:hypothetical protein
MMLGVSIVHRGRVHARRMMSLGCCCPGLAPSHASAERCQEHRSQNNKGYRISRHGQPFVKRACNGTPKHRAQKWIPVLRE